MFTDTSFLFFFSIYQVNFSDFVVTNKKIIFYQTVEIPTSLIS